MSSAIVYGTATAFSDTTLNHVIRPYEYIGATIMGSLADLYTDAVRNGDDIDWTTLTVESRRELGTVLLRFTADGAS